MMAASMPNTRFLIKLGILGSQAQFADYLKDRTLRAERSGWWDGGSYIHNF